MALPVRSGDGPPRRRAEEEVIRVDDVWPAIETLIPSIGVLILFYLVLKHILEGDRRERIAQAQWEREHDLRKGAVAPRAPSPQQNVRENTSVSGSVESQDFTRKGDSGTV